MKLGWVKSQRSRRDKRKEAEAHKKGPLAETPAPIEQAVKPTPRDPKEGSTPAVPIPLNPVLAADGEMGLPTPPQAELKRRSLRLRQQVQVVLRPDEQGDEIKVRNAVIEDIGSMGRLYLAQTSLPVLASDVGSQAEITFLARYFDLPGGRWLRVGYQTPILELIKDLRLGDDYVTDVFVVDPPQQLKPISIRTAFRIFPPQDLDLRLLLLPERTEVGLLDVSFGGAQFYHPRSWSYRVGTRLKLTLVSGEEEIKLGCRVVRQMEIKDRLGKKQGVTSVRFYGLDARARTRLTQLLTETYRHLLAQRSGL